MNEKYIYKTILLQFMIILFMEHNLKYIPRKARSHKTGETNREKIRTLNQGQSLY